MSHSFARLVFAFTALFFAAFFIWPVLQILKGGFIDADGRLTFAYLGALLADPVYLGGLRNSFLLACSATGLALLIALPLAVVTDRYLFPAKNLLGSLVLVPMILPPFVGAIGIKQIFGQYGALNALLHHVGLLAPGATVDWFAAHQFWGIAIVEALSLYPIIYLNAVAALANIDPAMEEAAQNLGCTGLRRFWKITLPLIRPGLFAGGTIVFIWAFTELGTPLIFDYDRVTSVQIYYGLKDIGANPFPFALVAVMLACSVALYALSKTLFGRQTHAMMAKATSSGGPRALPASRAWLCTLLFGGVTFLAVLPHLGVILVAFSQDWYGTVVPHTYTLDNFELALGHDLTVPAIANSLRFASISTLVDLVLGVAIAYVVVRSKVRGRQVLDFLAMLPLAVPGLVLAFGYLAMSQDGKFFSFLNPTRDPTILLIIAYSVRRLPYVVRSAAAGFQQTSETLEEAAQNMGAPPLKAVIKITLPLIMANLIAGGLLAFAFAMLEVSDSLILAQKQAFYPITKAILELFQLLGDGKFIASALGVWAMVFLGVTIAGLSLILGKKLGAIFRVRERPPHVCRVVRRHSCGPRPRLTPPMVQLIVVSLIWAFSFGLIKRHLVGVDSTFVAAARLGLALLVFLPFLRLRAINARLAVSLAAIGALQFGLMYLAYIESFRYLKAYEVGLFTITTPIFVTLFADALDRTLRGRALLAAVLAVIGTAFVTVRSSDVSLTLTGLALVQASNAAFAIGQVLYRRVRARHADLRDRDGFGLLYAGAFAVALAATLARGVHPTLTGPQIGTLLYLGVLASGVGFFLWNVGATRVSAGTLAVMNNAKVPLAVAVALIVFGEQANLPALLASFACLAAAVWLAQSQPTAATRAQRT